MAKTTRMALVCRRVQHTRVRCVVLFSPFADSQAYRRRQRDNNLLVDLLPRVTEHSAWDSIVFHRRDFAQMERFSSRPPTYSHQGFVDRVRRHVRGLALVGVAPNLNLANFSPLVRQHSEKCP